MMITESNGEYNVPVRVVNLSEDRVKIFMGVTPAGAVISAYAEEQKDGNTWDYWNKYSSKLVYGKKSVSCGDWSALLVDPSVETQEMPAVKICVDCKRAIKEPEKGSCTTGYARDAETGGFVCFECCAYRDKGDMIERGKIMLYLTLNVDQERVAKGHWARQGHKVTNWPGSLSFDCIRVTRGRHNIARVRYDCWFKAHDGFVWHGVQYGNYMQIVHCKRTKERWDQ